MYCGDCAVDVKTKIFNCPICRTSLSLTDKEFFNNLYELVHTRAVGRHTPFAHYNLGCNYQAGEGVKQNDREAAKYFKLAADEGNAEAQCNLGNFYLQGRGVKLDLGLAIKYHRLSADQGQVNSQLTAGHMLAIGKGCQQDRYTAAKYLVGASKQGSEGANTLLPILFDIGYSVKLDGLKTTSLNGCKGLVTKHLPNLRVEVTLDDHKEPKSIRFSNLILIPKHR
jgi:hypothetical protein